MPELFFSFSSMILSSYFWKDKIIKEDNEKRVDLACSVLLWTLFWPYKFPRHFLDSKGMKFVMARRSSGEHMSHARGYTQNGDSFRNNLLHY